MRPRTICVINQKGGCGKTSTCFHLGGRLAETGARVLLVDADPQGSLSQGFFGSELVESLPRERTLAAVVDPEQPRCVTPTPVANARARLFVLPANHLLAPFNAAMPDSLGARHFSISAYLESLADRFDYTLIDCPPNLYCSTWSALVASDFVLAPVNPEDFGAQGLRAVHHAIESARSFNPRLRLLGHLVNRTDRRLLVHRLFEQKLRERFGESVFSTTLPEAAAFKVGVVRREPVTWGQPRSVAAERTRRLADELLSRIADTSSQRSVAS